MAETERPPIPKPCECKVYEQADVYVKFIYHVSHEVICEPTPFTTP